VLDPSMALPNGLFHFRVVAGVRLLDPVVIEEDEEAGEEEMVGYYRTYGVTAASAGAAVSLVEKSCADLDQDDPAGVILEIDVALLDITEMDLPKPAEEIEAAGIHFESGRAFFPADEDDDLPD